MRPPNAAAKSNALMQPFRCCTDPLFPATQNSMNTPRANPLAAPLWTGLIRLVVALATLASATRVLAQANANPPERMTYQGFLTDANGTPLGNTAPKNYDVIFRIWKSESSTAAGDRLWTEQQTVTVDKGYFSVLLGEGGNIGEAKPALSTVFTGADASDRWVGITVKGIGAGGADSTILPRLRMLTSPYSYLAQKAISATSVDGGGVTSGTVADARLSSNVALRSGGNTFSGTQTVNGTVAATSVTGNGAGLTSLNANNVSSGTLADARLSGNVARRNEANTFTGNQRVAGLLRLGSETGTSQPPGFSGLVIRRVVSTSSASGQIVARDNAFVLERDGTAGGLLLRQLPGTSIGGGVVAATGLNSAGTAVNVFRTIYNNPGQKIGIFSQGQNIGYCKIVFGEGYWSGNTTEVTLFRFKDGGYDEPNWVGTVTSTYDQ